MPKMSSEVASPFQRSTLNGPTMGTRWSASVDTDDSVNQKALHQGLAAAVQQVYAQMSPWKQGSDLVRLNRAPVDTGSRKPE